MDYSISTRCFLCHMFRHLGDGDSYAYKELQDLAHLTHRVEKETHPGVSSHIQSALYYVSPEESIDGIRKERIRSCRLIRANFEQRSREHNKLPSDVSLANTTNRIESII